MRKALDSWGKNVIYICIYLVQRVLQNADCCLLFSCPHMYMWPGVQQASLSCQKFFKQLSNITGEGSISGTQLEKVAYSNIQDNQLHRPLTCWPLWRYQSLGKWPTLATALKWEGNVRSTHLIIDMLLFAFPAYLKSLKDMRKPGGPQERNT